MGTEKRSIYIKVLLPPFEEKKSQLGSSTLRTKFYL